jgi:hypothetical protein
LAREIAELFATEITEPSATEPTEQFATEMKRLAVATEMKRLAAAETPRVSLFGNACAGRRAHIPFPMKTLSVSV